IIKIDTLKCLRTGTITYINNLTISMHTPRHLGNRGKSIIIWRAQSSVTSRNGNFLIPAEGGRCLPARDRIYSASRNIGIKIVENK
ncbi:hypothetical protein P4K76_24130, partial [Bacillus cereus]|nr:hypothetical protein [Bacillus cereus]